MSRKLKPQQEEFCQNYMRHGNATRAMLEAYPSREKWNTNSKNSKASHLLKSPKIQARLEELREEAAAVSEMSRDDILRFLKRVISGEPVEDFTETKTVSGGEGGGGSITKVKTVSVQWAVTRLCAMCGFDAPEKREVTGAGGEPLLAPRSLTPEEAREFLRRLESEN